MPFIKRRPQPPGDEGSRGNLTASGKRKGNIENVEHGYSGIINIYALRPKGEDGKPSTISLSDFTQGFFSDLPVYSQTNKRVGNISGTVVSPRTNIINEPSKEQIEFGWTGEGNKSRRPELLLKRGGVPSKEGGNLTPQQYEAIMSAPGAVAKGLVASYDLSNPGDYKKVRRAMFEIYKKEGNPKAIADMLYHEARRLKVPMQQFTEWSKHEGITKEAYNVWRGSISERDRESKIGYLIRQIVESPSNTSLVQKNTDALKLSYGLTDDQIKSRLQGKLQNLKHGKRSDSGSGIESTFSPTPEPSTGPVVVVNKAPVELDITGGELSKYEESYYIPVGGEEAKSISSTKGSSVLKYRKGRNDEIIYYAPMKIFDEKTARRRKLQKTRVKRYKVIKRKSVTSKKSSKPSNRNKTKHIVKKVSRITQMKNKLLKSMKCKCNKKRGRK